MIKELTLSSHREGFMSNKPVIHLFYNDVYKRSKYYAKNLRYRFNKQLNRFRYDNEPVSESSPRNYPTERETYIDKYDLFKRDIAKELLILAEETSYMMFTPSEAPARMTIRSNNTYSFDPYSPDSSADVGVVYSNRNNAVYGNTETIAFDYSVINRMQETIDNLEREIYSNDHFQNRLNGNVSYLTSLIRNTLQTELQNINSRLATLESRSFR
jgi:hypothetical protein